MMENKCSKGSHICAYYAEDTSKEQQKQAMLLKKSVSIWLVSGVLCQSYKFKIHEEIIKNNELALCNFLRDTIHKEVV